ncbi:GntR family L-lactate dehydrogenase operon transcriptional regulator [Comamonas sp. BIGb0124]|uniref:transcriptional regulator LldR n=1 Tax=Comamonas sp. BIGb0124 TaxID=2485130 RepID=UPI000F49B4AD|nr:transcriptional regulator LldR [Comamonas sp. BIGb0124]ROR24252.1 GntR family L-lactate dehydrogenase operon transcriptional regulator [Comamonas sp. BIGb0124]
MRISDQAVHQLLALIQAGGFQAGQRLPSERSLAEQLGVSRTSLREAIQQLISQGVLSSRVGAGTFVQSPANHWPQRSVEPLAALILSDPQYRYDVLEARVALETSTTWHAALRATPEDKDKIRRCFDLMVEHQQGGDSERSAQADAQFHLAIAEASHNLVLVQVMRGLFDLVLSTVAQNRRLMFIHDSPHTVPRLTGQHEALMQAIVDGDPERARAVVGEHLDYVRATLIQTDEDTARRERAARLSSPPHAPTGP